MSPTSLTSRFKPTFQVPATRGRMGITDYYTATLPFGAVTKLFVFDPDEMLELTPENRSQRILNTKRVPEIANYVLEHEDYIFSAITVSVDADDVEFVSVEEGAAIGSLVLPLEAKYVINDGQHRVAGISEALRHDPSLAEDTISVVVLPDGGLERSQQIFSDLNRTVHKTSKSLDILFDHRLPINRITMACLEAVPLFQDRIDKERVSLSVRSPRFATLSGLQQANEQLLGRLPEKLPETEVDGLTSLTVDFWSRLTNLVVPWRDILDGDTKPQQARQVYVSSYALSLWALGFAGSAARTSCGNTDGDWTGILDGLQSIDWRKTNPDWQGICMADNEIVTRAPTRRATANYIMWKLGLKTERPKTVISEDRYRHAVARSSGRQAGPPGAPDTGRVAVTDRSHWRESRDIAAAARMLPVRAAEQLWALGPIEINHQALLTTVDGPEWRASWRASRHMPRLAPNERGWRVTKITVNENAAPARHDSLSLTDDICHLIKEARHLRLQEYPQHGVEIDDSEMYASYEEARDAAYTWLQTRLPSNLRSTYQALFDRSDTQAQG